MLAVSTFNASTQAGKELNDDFTHGRGQGRDRRTRPPAAGQGSKKRHHQWSPRSSACPFCGTYERLHLDISDSSMLKAEVVLQELLCIGQRGHLHKSVGMGRFAAQDGQAEERLSRRFLVWKRRNQEVDLAHNHQINQNPKDKPSQKNVVPNSLG